MRKMIAILGILLTVTVLISGSAVAGFVYGQSVAAAINCTNESKILGEYDYEHATIGNNSPNTLGLIVVDLGAGNGVPSGTEFTIFASSSEEEWYNVSVSEAMDSDLIYIGSNEDTANHNFNAPSTPTGKYYRFIHISGYTGRITGGDPIYGPEVDAVGWDKP